MISLKLNLREKERGSELFVFDGLSKIIRITRYFSRTSQSILWIIAMNTKLGRDSNSLCIKRIIVQVPFSGRSRPESNSGRFRSYRTVIQIRLRAGQSEIAAQYLLTLLGFSRPWSTRPRVMMRHWTMTGAVLWARGLLSLYKVNYHPTPLEYTFNDIRLIRQSRINF